MALTALRNELEDYADEIAQYNQQVQRYQRASDGYNNSVATFNGRPVVMSVSPAMMGMGPKTNYQVVKPDGMIGQTVYLNSAGTFQAQQPAPTAPNQFKKKQAPLIGSSAIPGSTKYKLARVAGTDVNGQYPTLPGDFTETAPAPISLTTGQAKNLYDGGPAAQERGGLINDVIRAGGPK